MRLTVVRSGPNLGQNGTTRYQNDITAAPPRRPWRYLGGVAGNVNVGDAVPVAVEVAVEVAVDVAVGLGRVVNPGVGKSGGEGTAECDERLIRLGETDAGAARDGALLADDAVLTGDS